MSDLHRRRSRPGVDRRYAVLEAFYEGVEAAISLLGIRRQLCTFQAVCAIVEAATQRRFLLRHLAQIKHILPEAVHLEYVRSYDSDTRNKKWELRISLLPLPAEEELPEGRSLKKKPKIETVQRRRAFRARLAKFASTHPEGDVPEHPLPERPLHGNSAPRIAEARGGLPRPEFTMPAATTCVPMEISTTAHRLELPESDVPAGSTHFSSSFAPAFSSKAAGSFVPAASPLRVDESEKMSPDSILPIRINRTSHRDVHNLAEVPAGTPHLAPSFKPFFSVKQPPHRTPAPELENELCDDSAPVDHHMPGASVNVTPLKRRHEAPAEEEADIPVPPELSTPIKIMRTGGGSKRPEFDSPSRSPHFSPSFKPHFSARQGVSSSRIDSVAAKDDTSCLLRTPVKTSLAKEFLNSPYVKTPGRTSDAEDHIDSPIEVSASAGLHTPVKSSTPADPFKSPCVATPAQNRGSSPYTPLDAGGARSSIDATQHARLSHSASVNASCESPILTPVKQASSMRALKFCSTADAKASGSPLSPQSKTPSRSGMAEPSMLPSPGAHVPSTPGMQTPVNPLRASRFKGGLSTKSSKLNLGPLFARNSDDDDDACPSDEAPGSPRDKQAAPAAPDASCASRNVFSAEPRSFKKSLSFASNAAVTEPRNLKKSLSFGMGDVTAADMNMIQSLPAEFVHSVMEEEKKVTAEQSKESTTLRRRQQMMAGIPQLFNQLRLIFQSSNRSVYPYKELLSQVLSSHTDMTDRGEVEERMKILVELAPDWISVRPAIAGDLLYRINKYVDVMDVRKRLCGAQ